MLLFWQILIQNIFPLFLIIAMGFIIQKKYHLNAGMFSKLLFNIYIPVLIFVSLYQTSIDFKFLKTIFLFLLLFHVLLYIIAIIFVRARKVEPKRGATIVNSILYYNCGNFGIPLVLLLFPDDPAAFTVQIIIVVLQTLLPYTLGIITINAGKFGFKQLLYELLKNPPLYAIFLAFIFKGANIGIPEPIMIPLVYINDGYTPLALLTLGIQIANIGWKIKFNQVALINILRLFISPIIAYGLVVLLGITGTMAQVLIISSAVPTALNVVILALEYDSDPDFASEIVLSTTIFSAFSISGIVFIVNHLF